jgi:transposase
METLYPRCAGLDVHKESVVVCIRHAEAGGKAIEQVRSFGTMSRDLLALGDWLVAEGVTQAAMESTGVYWKPVWNLLEDRLSLMLVNAQHIKQVPGRKTDVKDCQWIAQLLQHGLLRPSFVPARPQRELRDLTRQRTQLVADKARVSNRIQKVLEDANVKLGSVASDVLGASGRDMLKELIAGNADAAAMADLARYRMRAKIPQLREALSGKVTAHHRFMLKMLLKQVEHLDEQIATFDQQVQEVMSPLEKQAAERLDAMPGIDARSAEVIVAEVGTDMSRFPNEHHLASWAGLSPGNHQSAGKRRSGRTSPANRWLRTTLCQCALAAGRKKGSYYSAQYRRIAARRGRKRAAIAVAHSQIVAIYHLLEGAEHKDLGADYFDKLGSERLKRNLVARLERLGFKVNLEEKPAA